MYLPYTVIFLHFFKFQDVISIDINLSLIISLMLSIILYRLVMADGRYKSKCILIVIKKLESKNWKINIFMVDDKNLILYDVGRHLIPVVHKHPDMFNISLYRWVYEDNFV